MSAPEFDHQDPVPGSEGTREPSSLPHSDLGIVSCFIALLLVLLGMLAILLLVATAADKKDYAQAGSLLMVEGMLCIGFIMSLIGMGLGIVGMLLKDRNRTFALIGLAANGLILLSVAVLTLLRMMAVVVDSPP